LALFAVAAFVAVEWALVHQLVDALKVVFALGRLLLRSNRIGFLAAVAFGEGYLNTNKLDQLAQKVALE
jgi:hypothetical protein